MYTSVRFQSFTAFFFVEKGRSADATDAPQPEGFLCSPMMKMMIILCPFPRNGAPEE
jgi:hypothetical protein